MQGAEQETKTLDNQCFFFEQILNHS